MVTERFRGNQPNGFPSTLTRGNFVGGVGAEDEGVATTIGQVIGNSGVLINVVTVRVENIYGQQSTLPSSTSGHCIDDTHVSRSRGGRNELTLDRWWDPGYCQIGNGRRIDLRQYRGSCSKHGRGPW